MPASAPPAVGEWFALPDHQQFRINAIDARAQWVEIQYPDCSIEVLDMTTWNRMGAMPAAPPDNACNGRHAGKADLELDLLEVAPGTEGIHAMAIDEIDLRGI